MVGTAICQAVFDLMQEPLEDADLHSQLLPYRSYMKKISPRCKYPAELIAAMAQQEDILQIERTSYKKLRKDAGGLDPGKVSKEELLDWHKNVFFKDETGPTSPRTPASPGLSMRGI